jgi:regulator of cell morphogenesis and NO signaling
VKTIDVHTTLGDVVNAYPALARELERRGLDYCCGGRRTLEEACAAAGLDPEDVASRLAEACVPTDPAPWTTMNLVELVDHIEAVHHRYVWDELPRLDALLDKVVGVHGERHPELMAVAEVFAELRAEFEPHLIKEERVLFPMIRELAIAQEPPTFHCGSVANPISVMMREHDAAGEILQRLRALTDSYRAPADGCVSYRRLFEGLEGLEIDTHFHIQKENNLLFPMVVQREQALIPSS